MLTPSSPTKPEVTSSANPSTVSDSGTDVSWTCAYIRSRRDSPMRDMLRSADSLIALADSPSISITAPSEPTNPAEGASGRAPTLVAMTISSPMPRLRRQRPSSFSLSPPWVPLTQNA